MKVTKITKHGKVKFQADLGVFKGRRERHLFDKEKDAKAFVKAKQQELERDGIHAFNIPHDKRLDYMAAEEKLAAVGASIHQAVAFFLAFGQQLHHKSLKDAFVEFEIIKKTSGKRKPYTDPLLMTCKSFVTSREAVPCSAITPQVIEEWSRLPVTINRLKMKKGEPPKPGTVNQRIAFLKVFFQFCKKRKYCLANPTIDIERIAIEQRPPSIHSIADAKRLLMACLTHPKGEFILWYVALVYFGGLRPTEAYYLDKHDIKDGLIEISPYKAKTRRRRFITINSTLKAWLEHSKFKIYRPSLSRNLRIVRASLKNFPWEHDVLRHSFCSYSLPVYGAKVTAEQAGHSEKILFSHYRERVKMEDAKAFWELTPENVRQNAVDGQ